MTNNSRIVRPGESGGTPTTSAAVTDPRFVGIAEAASAPMHEFHSAMEFRRSLPSAAATAEAIGDFFDKYAETAKSSVWLNPAFADSMKQSKTFQRLMKESIDQQEQMFDNLHAERLERIARGSQEDKAWDVTRNQHYL